MLLAGIFAKEINLLGLGQLIQLLKSIQGLLFKFLYGLGTKGQGIGTAFAVKSVEKKRIKGTGVLYHIFGGVNAFAVGQTFEKDSADLQNFGDFFND